MLTNDKDGDNYRVGEERAGGEQIIIVAKKHRANKNGPSYHIQ